MYLRDPQVGDVTVVLSERNLRCLLGLLHSKSNLAKHISRFDDEGYRLTLVVQSDDEHYDVPQDEQDWLVGQGLFAFESTFKER